MIADYDPTRVLVTFGGQQVTGFGANQQIIAGSPITPARIEFTLRENTESADQLFALAGKPKPWPLLLRTRDRPKRRAHARGGLRRMVRQRRQFIVHESTLGGGVSQPLEVKLGVSRRPKDRSAASSD